MNGDINARDSICPKGWKLPTSGDLSVASNLLNGSIFNQLAGYGLAAEIDPSNSVFTSNILSVASNPTVKRRTDLGGNTPDAWPTLGVTNIKTSVRAAEFDARTQPLYYAYTGTIGPWREGGKINLGIGGWFWPSTGSSGYGGYRVAWLYGARDNFISPAMATWDRTNAYTLRCLAW